uniref:ABC transporter domain-containing protein n=1 Tax=Lotharella globosa TaxID=91324 RepID=A0A7S4DZU4_9EUKA
MMPATFFDTWAIMLKVLGVVILVCVINPVLFIATVPLILGSSWIYRMYVRTSREVKRLEAVSRSPVFSIISETLVGMVAVRAYGQTRRFRLAFNERIDRNVEGFFAFIASARWLGIRLDVLTLAFTTCVLYAAILMQWLGFSISSGLVGLSLAYLVQLGDAFQWSVRQSAEFENQLVSVERILSYISLTPEPPLTVPSRDRLIKDTWPSEGGIRFEHFSARYAPELPLVLNDLTLEIPSRSKVAIVGRTGAGKSSVVQCLFRLIEADDPQSRLVIDGVHVREIGLHKLRSRISVIPQTPWLFSGSIRENLDPFHEHKDRDIWEALEAVRLKESFGSLDDPISESGGNLSSGQKQLACLARAILRKNQILVLDEATAHVDLHTDAIIQTTIREKFSGQTVIMIAHRLETVIDVDRVLVLDHGHLVEQGHPFELLSSAFTVDAKKKKNGCGAGNRGGGAIIGAKRQWFASMVQETGEENAKKLYQAAKEAWNEKERR